MSFNRFMNTPVTIYHVTSRDKWSKPLTADSSSEKCRIEDSKVLHVADAQMTVSKPTRIFLNPDVLIVEGDQAEIDGTLYTVVQVSKMRDKRGVVRHLEVTL
ncbi:MAG: hypothetical protein SVY53_08565 [Chloroflexota bacterium]|nr:hypothetical protein [Chloroflexota bacterium]